MEVLGHLKIGETVRGLASQTSKIMLTQTGKGGGESFLPYAGFEEGVDSVKVKLPFIYNVLENFKVSEIAFVDLNEIYKYRAEVVEDIVYLFPYQPNFENPLIDLPVIKLGLSKDWKDKLSLRLSAIGYFIPIEFNRVFDFKTLSTFSIVEITKILKLIDTLPAHIVADLELELVYKKKIFKTEKTEEVRYLTLSEVTPSMIVNSTSLSSDIAPFKFIENSKLKQVQNSIDSALSMEEAKEFFKVKNIIMKISSFENGGFGDFGMIDNINEGFDNIEAKKLELNKKQEKKEGILSNNTDQIDLLVENKIPLPIAKALVVKKGDKSFEFAKSVDFKQDSIIKFIAQTNAS